MTDDELTITQRINQEIKDVLDDRSGISDGYHTFEELYDHRVMLFMALCKALYDHHPSTHFPYGIKVWRSWKHSDGSQLPGWFIMGLGKIQGRQITYHLPEKVWELTEFAETLEEAPAWDGHTPEDVLDRIKKQFLQP